MEVRQLRNGLEIEFDVLPTDHGYMIVHRARGTTEYTVTCTCEGKGSVTKTCTYPEGEPPSPTCNCTGDKPEITC